MSGERMDGNGVFRDQYGAPIGKLDGSGYIYGHTEAPAPGGASGLDSNYLHTQNTPLDTWHVVHNLGKFPSVTVIDSGGATVEGAVVHNSVNDCTIQFTAAFAGSASLN